MFFLPLRSSLLETVEESEMFRRAFERASSRTPLSSVPDSSSLLFFPDDIIKVIISKLDNDFSTRFSRLGLMCKRIRALVLSTPLPSFVSFDDSSRNINPFSELFASYSKKQYKAILDANVGGSEASRRLNEATRDLIYRGDLSPFNYYGVKRLVLGTVSPVIIDVLSSNFPNLEYLKIAQLSDHANVFTTSFGTVQQNTVQFDSSSYSDCLLKFPNLKTLKVRSLTVSGLLFPKILEKLVIVPDFRWQRDADDRTERLISDLSTLPRLSSLRIRRLFLLPLASVRISSGDNFFAHLRKFDVYIGNNRQRALFESVPELPSVVELVLRCKVFPDFAKFYGLQTLILKDTYSSIPRTKVRRLNRLKVLRLSWRQSGVLSEFSDLFPELEELSDNQFLFRRSMSSLDDDDDDQSDSDSFAEEADRGRRFLDTDDLALRSFHQLRKLALSGEFDLKLLSGSLRGLYNLNSLSLHSLIAIKTADVDVDTLLMAICEFRQLRHLCLEEFPLTQKCLSALSHSLSSLKSLNLLIPSHIRISDDWVSPISKFNRLEELRLSRSSRASYYTAISLIGLGTDPIENNFDLPSEKMGKEINSDLVLSKFQNDKAVESNLLSRRGIVVTLSPLKNLKTLSLIDCTYNIDKDDIGKYLSPGIRRLTIESPMEANSRILGSRKLFNLLGLAVILFLLYIFYLTFSKDVKSLLSYLH